MTIEVTSAFRARTIRSKSGHCIHFERNETKAIPESLLEEAIQNGLVPAEEIDVRLGTDVAKEPVITGSQREAKIREAVETILSRELRDDWNGAGNPSKEVVSMLAGFKVDQREVTAIYKVVKDEAWDAD